jgi:hypothetical protein
MDLDGWELKLFYGVYGGTELGTNFPSRRGLQNIVPYTWVEIKIPRTYNV